MSSRARNLTFKLVLLGDDTSLYVSLLVNAAALLVYDITDTDTFLRVRKWVKELQQMASKDIVMVIAANKSDLIRSKNYDIQGAESYATTIGAKLFLTSAKSGTGINDVFLDIAARELTIHTRETNCIIFFVTTGSSIPSMASLPGLTLITDIIHRLRELRSHVGVSFPSTASGFFPPISHAPRARPPSETFCRG
ncbi:hypothetical protein BHE74_00027493 [Ensete ventricosum]|nr:hypothetical protein BHE74_00027493 [Ensete ventricosum]